MILPLQDVIAAQISRAYRFGYFGLILIIKGHEELFFEIGDKDSRDTFQHLLEQQVDFAKESPQANRLPTALEEVKRLQELQTPTAHAEGSASPPSDFADVPAIMFHSQSSSFLDFKPQEQMHFVCLTIGQLIGAITASWVLPGLIGLACRVSRRCSALHCALQRSSG